MLRVGEVPKEKNDQNFVTNKSGAEERLRNLE